MESIIKQVAELMVRNRPCAALTGAGISTESGIPPFRGAGGLWEKFDPMEVAHIDAFVANPAFVWRVLVKDLKDVIDHAQPNDGHKGLARLEALGILQTVITQNIDGLHQMAGNTDVIEFHGSFAWQRCTECETRVPTREVDASVLPPRCSCGGILRPDAVLFGEMIPPEALWRSQEVAARCGVMLVIGTSGVVQPAASLPHIAKQHGAVVVEVNIERAFSSADFFLEGRAGSVLSRLVSAINKA
jgi:NAD-dependent deacetylase